MYPVWGYVKKVHYPFYVVSRMAQRYDKDVRFIYPCESIEQSEEIKQYLKAFNPSMTHVRTIKTRPNYDTSKYLVKWQACNYMVYERAERYAQWLKGGKIET